MTRSTGAAAVSPAGVSVADLVALYEDNERCASAVGLRYVLGDVPGLRRVRRGRGFSYVDAQGRPVPREVRARIEALVIPPAWTDVWISLDDDAHLLATGQDDRGRKQYLYHERWREFRDLLNFYRLIDVGQRLPAVRAHVAEQMRRRTVDRDRVLATMLRIVDLCGLRVGSEAYADENDSYGLTTLTKKHVAVDGDRVHFCFPAKSGQQADVHLDDRPVATVLRALLAQPGRRLFAPGRKPVAADELNARLGGLAGAHVTAKDFRTWKGTVTAFSVLTRHLPPGPDAEQRVLAAVDAASEALGNTRAVARAHYVHPHVTGSYLDGSFADLQRRPARITGLTLDERRLLPFLQALLERHLEQFR